MSFMIFNSELHTCASISRTDTPHTSSSVTADISPQECVFFRTLAVGRVTTTLHVCSLHLEAQSKVQMVPHELNRRDTPVYMETPLFSTYRPEKTEGAYNLRVRKQTAQKGRASGQRTLNSVASTLLGSNN